MTGGESIVFGDGYNKGPVTTPYTNPTPGGYHPTNIQGTYFETVQVWVPPTPYIPATPTIAPTPTQVNYDKNKGWNSWANSIGQVARGKYYEFSCSEGMEGCCLGVAPANMIGQAISKFSHSIVVDIRGVHIQENGVTVKTLKNSQSSVSKIRIYWQEDNKIVYVVTTLTETIVYTSQTGYNKPSAFIYAHIYTGGDKILSSEITPGTVQYGRL